jgi:hypothetical protein
MAKRIKETDEERRKKHMEKVDRVNKEHKARRAKLNEIKHTIYRGPGRPKEGEAKTPLGVSVPVSIYEWVTKEARRLSLNRTSMVIYMLRKFYEHGDKAIESFERDIPTHSKKVSLSVSITEDQDKWLESIAQGEGITKSALIGRMIDAAKVLVG